MFGKRPRRFGAVLGAAGLLSTVLAGAAVTVSIVEAAPAAAAGTCAPGRVANGATFTDTFCFTGGSQTWTVPAGVSQATFTLYGGQGGQAAAPAPPTPAPPGVGGGLTATLPVAAGTVLQVNVGQGWPLGGGTSAGASFGGGGAAGPAAGGGGGASDVRIPRLTGPTRS
jgi:hypothetical protein